MRVRPPAPCSGTNKALAAQYLATRGVGAATKVVGTAGTKLADAATNPATYKGRSEGRRPVRGSRVGLRWSGGPGRSDGRASPAEAPPQYRPRRRNGQLGPGPQR